MDDVIVVVGQQVLWIAWGLGVAIRVFGVQSMIEDASMSFLVVVKYLLLEDSVVLSAINQLDSVSVEVDLVQLVFFT